MSKVFHSENIYTENGVFHGYMKVEEGKIQELSKTYIPCDECIELNDQFVLPGIVDIHNHGYLGYSAKSIDRKEIQGLSNMLTSIGVTSVLATTSAWEKEEFHMLQEISSAIQDGCDGAKVLGIHMEGPFFNPNKHNATALSEVQVPSVEKIKKYIEASCGYLRYMTLAPEMPHAFDVMEYLKNADISIGCGHTEATYKEFQRAKSHGMTSSIHTGNAMNQITQREVGFMGGALLDPDIYCEIICDGFHLSKEMLELMFRIKKDFSKFIMISDSDILSGVAPGTYYAFEKNVHVQKDGRILLDDGTINGSSKNVLYGIKFLVQNLYIPIEEVIKMCAYNPASLLGLQHEIGSIAQGKCADFIVLDKDFILQETYVNGERKFKVGDYITENANFATICKRLCE